MVDNLPKRQYNGFMERFSCNTTEQYCAQTVGVKF